MNHEPRWALILYRGYDSNVEWFCSREEAERHVPPNAVSVSHDGTATVFTVIDVLAAVNRGDIPSRRTRERRRLVAPTDEEQPTEEVGEHGRSDDVADR